MTHFSSRIRLLPLSPILIVKFHLILEWLIYVNFWSFLSDFWSNVVNFSEKVWFPIKNRVFWLIFDLKFHLKLIKKGVILGSFLGFLGGYPSPSISAPLVVKKCPKLYIYNIGYGVPAHNRPLWYSSYPKAPMAKCANSRGHKNTEGRTRVTRFTTPCESPRHLNLN